MKAVILSAAAMVLSGVTLASSASAGMAVTCMDQLEMEAALIDWYGARLDEDTPVPGLEYWISDDSGAWALVDRRADGIACVMARGLGLEPAAQPVAQHLGPQVPAG